MKLSLLLTVVTRIFTHNCIVLFQVMIMLSYKRLVVNPVNVSPVVIANTNNIQSTAEERRPIL